MKYYYLKRHKGIFKYFQHSHIKYGYRLRFSINHKQHEKSKRGFTNLNDAITAYNNIKNFTIDGNNKGNITVKAWCHHYLNTIIKPPLRKISTYKNYQRLLTENIIPRIGNVTLKNLKLDSYQTNVINQLFKKGLSRRTVLETNARFQTIINYAVKARYIKLNPIKFATISDINNRPKKVIMNNKELAKFNATLRKQPINVQVLFFTLETTGMRIGELLGLRWLDVDLKNGIIHINHTRDELGLRAPKTPHSKRKFQITKFLNKLLLKYAIYCKKHFKMNSHSFVLLNKRGKPYLVTFASRELKRLLLLSGLPNLVNRFSPHSMRHFFASTLIDKGVSPITVASILGHANPDITLKVYANEKHNVTPDLNKLIK